MPNKDAKTGIHPQKTIRSICIGAALSLLSCLLLLLPLSALVSSGLLPEKSMSKLCLLLLAICALVGGRFAVKRGELAPLASATITGVLICLLLLAVSFLGFGEPTGGSLWMLLAALLGSILASFFGKGKSPKKRKKLYDRS